jgi:hypothetical protein
MSDTDDLVKKALEYRPVYDIPPIYDPSWFGDPTKFDYTKIGRETTQGTPVKRTPEPEPKPEPLGWHYITIPEEDEE